MPPHLCDMYGTSQFDSVPATEIHMYQEILVKIRTNNNDDNYYDDDNDDDNDNNNNN